MSDYPIMMLAGLGNPGSKYTRTRHNIGFSVIDEVAGLFSLSIDKSRFDALYSSGTYGGTRIILVKPQSFMNRSGFPIQRICSYFRINPSDLVVVHDDIDLEFGKLKLVKNRGHGGHNGIKSIIQTLGTKDFIRVKIGVGRPHEQNNVISHVLSTFSKEEEKALHKIIEKSVTACKTILELGIEKAMNLYNNTF